MAWRAGAQVAVVALVAMLAQDAVAQTELSCTERQELLSTRVIQCFAHSRAEAMTPSPPPPPLNRSFLYPPAPPVYRVTPSEMLQACFANAGQSVQAITALAPLEAQAFIVPILRQFADDSGLQLSVTYNLTTVAIQELKRSINANATASYNIFLSQPEQMGELSTLGLYADLGPFVNNDASGLYGALWQEIHPFFRKNLAIANGRIVAVPFSTYVPYMYWRTDIFAKFNLTPPQTWEEVVQVATFLNNTNWDPKIRNKMALCFAKPKIASMGIPSGHYLLTSILGSMTQYQGKAQGLLYDPLTMTPLVRNAAMVHALEIYHQLAALLPDHLLPNGTDMLLQAPMTDGACALAFRWAEVFKMSPYSVHLKGNQGISLLPGSTKVLDRTTNTFMDCTATLCQGSDAIQRRDPATGANVTYWVNRVIYGALSGFSASVNAFSAKGYQEAAYQAVAFVGEATLDSANYMFSPIVPFGPIKTKQLSLETSALGLWPAIYNRTDVTNFIKATLDIVAHPNAILDLKTANQNQIKAIMDDAARMVERDGLSAIPAIMNVTYDKLNAVPANFQPGGLAAFQYIYWAGIEYTPPPSPPPPINNGSRNAPPTNGPASSGSQSNNQAVTVAVGVAVSVGVVGMLVVVLVMFVMRRKARHQTFLGHIVAPGVGPLTTLLVTDVQSSTSLWDTLPQEVMEQAVALHYAVLRKVAYTNGGYESATEGDSIILGFHTPLDATKAAAQAQIELLHADWPQGLLSHPLCAAQYAEPATSHAQEGLPGATASALESLPPFPLWDNAAAQPAAPEAKPAPTTNHSGLRKLFGGMVSFRSGSSGNQASALANSRKSFALPLVLGNAQAMAHPQEPEASNFSTVADYLASLLKISPDTPNRVGQVLFRGLRVRIGMHTGIKDASAITNSKRTSQIQYTGEPLQIATAVCAAGHGGMVLLSGDTFCQLDGPSLVSKGLLLASMGSNQLMDIDYPMDLYQILSYQLAYRTCFSSPLRYSQQLTPSFLEAPYDQMTVCYMYTVGLSALNAWSPSITQASVSLCQSVACSQLEKHKGYLVNSSTGMILVAFKHPTYAIRWALCTIQQCLEADWDPALLEHELGEEVVVGHSVAEVTEEGPGDVSTSDDQRLSHMQPADGRVSSMTQQSEQHNSAASRRHGVVKMVTRKTVLFRGLRLKCAVDVGQAKGSLEPSTGRMMYFGRVMNRCARISAMTKTGQVWCSQDAWEMAAPTINSLEARTIGLADWTENELAEQLDEASAGRTTPFPMSQQLGFSKGATPPALPKPSAALLTRLSNPSPEDTIPVQPSDIDLHELPASMENPADTRTSQSSDAPTSPLRKSKTSEDLTGLAAAEAVPQQGPMKVTVNQVFALDGPNGGRRTSADGMAARRMVLGLRRAREWSNPGTVMRLGASPLTHVSKGELLAPLPATQAASEDGGAAQLYPEPMLASHSPSVTSSARSAAASGIMLLGGKAENNTKYASRMPMLLVAGVPLGRCKLRGIQESVALVQCRFDDQSVVQVPKTQQPRPSGSESGMDLYPATDGTRGSRPSLASKTSTAAGRTSAHLLAPGLLYADRVSGSKARSGPTSRTADEEGSNRGKRRPAHSVSFKCPREEDANEEEDYEEQPLGRRLQKALSSRLSVPAGDAQEGAGYPPDGASHPAAGDNGSSCEEDGDGMGYGHDWDDPYGEDEPTHALIPM